MGSFLENRAFCVEEGEGVLNNTLKNQDNIFEHGLNADIRFKNITFMKKILIIPMLV